MKTSVLVLVFFLLAIRTSDCVAQYIARANGHPDLISTTTPKFPLHEITEQNSYVGSLPTDSSKPDGKFGRVGYDDCVLIASTRACPNTEGRALDFNQFLGFTCGANGEPTDIPTSLVEPNLFSETWVFMHGNQIPPREAVKRGVAVYTRLRSCIPCDGPVRFVIWSWPSERKTNRLFDARLKEKRTNVESFFFGSYLAAIASDTPVKIVGYSFGARIVCGGLHLASGGQIDGFCLSNAVTPIRPYQLVLYAAAVENDGFGNRYNRSLTYADRLLLMNNSRDQALRFYWVINSSKPKALGNTGLDVRPVHVSVEQYDWGEQFGRDHSLWRYLDNSFVLQRTAATLATP